MILCILRHLTWRLVSRSIILSPTWGTWALNRTGTWWKSWSEVRSVYEGRTLYWDIFTDHRHEKSSIYVFITSLNLGPLLRVLSGCCYMLSYLHSIDGQLRPCSLQTQIVYPNLSCISLTTCQHQSAAAIFSVYSQFLGLTPATEHRAGVMTSYLREDLNTTELVCSLSDVVTRVGSTLGTLDSPPWTLTGRHHCLLWRGPISQHARLRSVPSQ